MAGDLCHEVQCFRIELLAEGAEEAGCFQRKIPLVTDLSQSLCYGIVIDFSREGAGVQIPEEIGVMDMERLQPVTQHFDRIGGVMTGTVALIKNVAGAYGEYEQLVGGVDTLFKESSGKLQTYASNAYKTAGMSANDYMETIFSRD